MDFVHLHLHTCYGLVDSTIKIEPLLDCVRSYGMNACAITDHGNMHGVPHFYFTAQELGIKPIIGIEAYIDSQTTDRKKLRSPEKYHIILLAYNNIGYHNLIKFASYAQLKGSKSILNINKDILKKHSEGLIFLTSCIKGEIPSRILEGDDALLHKTIEEYTSIFNERFFFELQNNNLKAQTIVNEKLITLSKYFGIPLLATNNCHYLNKADAKVYSSLLRAGKGEDKNLLYYPKKSLHVKSKEEMYASFSNFPEALSNTMRIAEMCNVSIEETIRWPDYTAWSAVNAHEYLSELAGKGLKKLCQTLPGNSLTHYKERLDYELDVIEKTSFSQYFLVVTDYIEYAKTRGIPIAPLNHESASLLVHCLGITDIDPIKHNLSFEMFMDPKRINIPDIDVAFSTRGRDEVITYLSNKYGKEHVANVINFHSRQLKGCASDGLICRASIDNSAFLLSDDLSDHVPLYQKNNSVPLTHYDRKGLASMGFIPYDLYSLRQLDLLQTVLDLLKADGISVNLSTIPLDDDETYKFMVSKDISGVFLHKEHRMKGLLGKIKPYRFEDFVPLIAINSSPSLNKSIVEEYIKNINNPSLIHYETPVMEEILSGTYGIILYIEQIKEIAAVIAQLSADEAYMLRRTVKLQESTEHIKDLEELFIKKSGLNGTPEDIAKKIYNNMLYVGKNIYSKSRATSSALFAYQVAYLKANYYEYFKRS